jgi:hypothetical protein
MNLIYRTYIIAHQRAQAQEYDQFMNITLILTPLISIIAGILILAIPRLLNFIVAIYLIVVGLIGLFGAGNFHF